MQKTKSQKKQSRQQEQKPSMGVSAFNALLKKVANSPHIPNAKLKKTKVYS